MQENSICKICDSKRIWIIKKYHITNREVWPWQEVYEQIKGVPYPLLFGLGFVCRVASSFTLIRSLITT